MKLNTEGVKITPHFLLTGPDEKPLTTPEGYLKMNDNENHVRMILRLSFDFESPIYQKDKITQEDVEKFKKDSINLLKNYD